MLNKRTTRLIGYFLKIYPRKSAVIITLMFFSGLAEGFGVISILPLLEIAVGEAEQPSALMVFAQDRLGEIGLQPTPGVLLLFIVTGLFLKGGFMWLATRQQGYAVAGIATDLRLTLIRAFLNARWSYFVKQRTGHISNAIGPEAHIASMAYAAVCGLMAGIIQVLLYTALAFMISPTVALAALVAGAFLITLLMGLVRMGREAGERQMELIKSLTTRLVDTVFGIKPIKAMAREADIQPLLEEETRELNRAQRRQVIASGTLGTMQEPLLASVLAIGLYVLLTFSTVPFSGLIVMVFLFHRLVGRVTLLQAYYQSLAWSESTFWSLRDSIDQAEAAAEPAAGRTAPPPLRQGIELTGVDFGYLEHKLVLKDASLQIPAGALVAVIGPSGSGKTTLVDLVLGLYQPQRGKLRVDGIPLEEIDIYAWRAKIGYVPQELLLFHDSVRRNVTLGDPSLSDADVEEALRAAGAWHFVSRLPDGLETTIGERGAQLSGGQRQRISIARALVRKPVLLVLDEATTSLDPETEAEICETLHKLRGSITIIAISHQPAIKNVADVVYQVEDGTVFESKPLDDLAALARV
jgi:ATP-binding cassette, subfamily C, bacterial